MGTVLDTPIKICELVVNALFKKNRSVTSAAWFAGVNTTNGRPAGPKFGVTLIVMALVFAPLPLITLPVWIIKVPVR
jgi:hypothetical protein